MRPVPGWNIHLDRPTARLHPSAEIFAGMAQACDDGIEIGKLRLVDGAMPEIRRDGLGETVRMAQKRLGQRVEGLGPPFRRRGPCSSQGAPLPVQARLQPVS